MDAFLSAHADRITGVLSLFDRILIKGHLPLGYPQGMEKLLLRHGKLFKDLKGFVLQQSERIKDHARRLAVVHLRAAAALSQAAAGRTPAATSAERLAAIGAAP